MFVFQKGGAYEEFLAGIGLMFFQKGGAYEESLVKICRVSGE